MIIQIFNHKQANTCLVKKLNQIDKNRVEKNWILERRTLLAERAQSYYLEADHRLYGRPEVRSFPFSHSRVCKTCFPIAISRSNLTGITIAIFNIHLYYIFLEYL